MTIIKENNEFNHISNKKLLNVICLSFRTPPAVRPQAILIGKMIPEWVRQGVNPVILTYDNNGDWKIDLPIYKIKQFSINRFLNKIPLLPRLLRKRYFEEIYKITKKILKKHKINLIYSFSSPLESNILGAMLKKRLGIKFISHFSDPWYDSPLNHLSYFKAKNILKKERQIIKKSDKVIFVNNQLRDLVMRKYPNNWIKKSEIIPHCYDPKDYPDIKKEKKEKLVFSYIGVFYKQRNPEIVFKVLSELINEDKSIKDKFILKLVGYNSSYAGYSLENLNNIIKLYNLENNIELVSTVEYKKSLRYMKQSDCLFVVDADFSNSPFLPSKLIDYAGSGSKIIGITPENSPTDDFLKKLGYRSFDYNETNKLKNYLYELINGKTVEILDKNFLNQYDVSVTTSKLLKIFFETLNSK